MSGIIQALDKYFLNEWLDRSSNGNVSPLKRQLCGEGTVLDTESYLLVTQKGHQFQGFVKLGTQNYTTDRIIMKNSIVPDCCC